MKITSVAVSLAASLLATATITRAQAADIPRRSAPQASFQSAPPMFTWTGFYVGANAGAIWGDFTKATKGVGASTGFTAGGTLGYNHQIGQFVMGVEGDYNYSGLGGRGFLTPGLAAARADLTSFGTVRGRLGVAFDRALVYGTATRRRRPGSSSNPPPTMAMPSAAGLNMPSPRTSRPRRNISTCRSIQRVCPSCPVSVSGPRLALMPAWCAAA
jgi:hypothetical protein